MDWSGLGCNAGGHQVCRFCEFGQYEDVECPQEILLEMIISLDPSKYDEVQLLEYMRGRRLLSSNRTIEGAFAEGLAEWLSVSPESVTAEIIPLTNSTATLSVSIYTQGADRTRQMISRLEELSPAIVMESLGLEGYPIAITEVKEPVVVNTPAPIEAVPAAGTIAMVSTILVLGVAVVAVICRRVRTRWFREKKDYGRSAMDSFPAPRTLGVSCVHRIDNTTPKLAGPAAQRRNSDPGAASHEVRVERPHEDPHGNGISTASAAFRWLIAAEHALPINEQRPTELELNKLRQLTSTGYATSTSSTSADSPRSDQSALSPSSWSPGTKRSQEQAPRLPHILTSEASVATRFPKPRSPVIHV